MSNEPILIAASLVVVYVILGVLYESYIHPLTILSTLPSAGVGALLALWVGGFDLSVIGIIGIILLIGIVKKNGIMLVDFAINRERAGLPPREAIRQACLLRFRPIMMTTMTALLSGLPLMFGHGSGSELRQPLGYAMVGGLALSQLLTLFTTPVIYLYLDRFQTWLSGEQRRARGSGTAAACRRIGRAPGANSFQKYINRNFATEKAAARNPASDRHAFSSLNHDERNKDQRGEPRDEKTYAWSRYCGSADDRRRAGHGAGRRSRRPGRRRHRRRRVTYYYGGCGYYNYPCGGPYYDYYGGPSVVIGGGGWHGHPHFHGHWHR